MTIFHHPSESHKYLQLIVTCILDVVRDQYLLHGKGSCVCVKRKGSLVAEVSNVDRHADRYNAYFFFIKLFFCNFVLQPCTSTDDGLYPLADLKLSAKAVLFLRPLTVEGGLVKSVQLNVVPVTLSLIQQGGFKGHCCMLTQYCIPLLFLLITSYMYSHNIINGIESDSMFVPSY